MVLDAWTTMRSPMKYLDMLLSQLWLRRVNLGYSQVQVTQLSILLGNLTIHYIPMSKSYHTGMYLWLRRANDGYSPLPMLWILAHQHKVKKNRKYLSNWGRDLFSKTGSCFSSTGSGRPSITLCVFHWTRISIKIGFVEIGTSLQSFACQEIFATVRKTMPKNQSESSVNRISWGNSCAIC